MITLRRSELDKIDLNPLRGFAPSQAEFLDKREHYRLLAYLSTFFPGERIVDIGTNYGSSALAFSYSNGPVHSFDIEDRAGRPNQPNIFYHLEDLWDPAIREKHKRLLLESPLIFIDIDPHEGTRELELVQWLEANKYPGLIGLDDIWFFKAMRDNLWYRIPPQWRTDVTAIGHWSGTGIISFDKRVEFENDRDTSNWTLVTGYFDLTKAPDANDAIRTRPTEHYIDNHGSSVLSRRENLVVFCEPELEPKIWEIRPPWLHARTCVIPMSFEDFSLTRHRSKIIENRGGVSGCAADPRNTASYYLFCMARYAMLKHAMRDNVFKSTHFAWINICIERMGFNNLIHLDEALGLNRDGLSTCFIDYAPVIRTGDLSAHFGPRGCRECRAACSMCSGFFTGNLKNMREFCNLTEGAFFDCLDSSLGHADEQLYPIVYRKNPEIFDWYIGDYSEMITNYAGVYEHPERPIRNLIRNSLANGDHGVCRRACDILLESHSSGKCVPEHDDFVALTSAKDACK